MTMANDIVVGFVGLGTMGGKMATNILKAGYKVVVHDLHRQSAGHHLQEGAEWADTPRALAERSDVIFTSLPEPADVESVSLGPDGLIEGVRDGAVYFDLSTNSQGVGGRRFTFDGLLDQFLPGKYDPPNFALKLATKDVALATALGRELGVPMRICNLAYAEMREACNRGWEGRDSRSVMLLEQERAGVEIAADPERVKQAAERAKSG